MTTPAIPSLLITPPWQIKGLRIKAPEFPDETQLNALPPLLLKDGTPLSNEQIKNLIGILLKSDDKAWVKPLDNDSFLELLSAFNQESLHQFAKAIQEQFGLDWYGYCTLTPLDTEMIGHIVGYMYDHYAVLRIRLDVLDYLKMEEGYNIFESKEYAETTLNKHCPYPSPSYHESYLLKILLTNYRLYHNEWALASLFFISQNTIGYGRSESKRLLKKFIETTGLSEQEFEKVRPSDKEIKAIAIKKSDYKTYEELLMAGFYI